MAVAEKNVVVADDAHAGRAAVVVAVAAAAVVDDAPFAVVGVVGVVVAGSVGKEARDWLGNGSVAVAGSTRLEHSYSQCNC